MKKSEEKLKCCSNVVIPMWYGTLQATKEKSISGYDNMLEKDFHS